MTLRNELELFLTGRFLSPSGYAFVFVVGMVVGLIIGLLV